MDRETVRPSLQVMSTNSGEEEELDILPLFFDEVNNEFTEMLGSVGEFDASQETWASYIERFELFCDCNKVEENKKVCTLLTVIGVKTYSLLRNLCTPDKPSSKEFDEIVKIIQEHLYPKPSFIAERYTFSRRNQLDHESVSDYIATLKRLSIHCEFGASLNDYLRDRLVSGIRSESTKQRLLAEASLTYEEAVKIVLSVEAAEKHASVLVSSDSARSGGQIQLMTHRWKAEGIPQQQGRPKQQSSSGGPSQQQSSSVRCFCCGKTGHISKECRLRGCVCHKCGKKNHIASVCKSNQPRGKSKQFSNNSYKRKHNYVGQVEQSQGLDDNDDNLDGVANLYEIRETGHSLNNPSSNLHSLKISPVKLDVNIEGKQVTMELDTGASVSVCNKNFYTKNLSSFELLPTNLSLSSYTDEPIVPLGKVKVTVAYQNVKTKLDLYVIEKGAHPLMGREWLHALGVEISFKSNLFEIAKGKPASDEFLVEQNVNKIVQDFPEVFSEKLGEYKGDPIKLRLKPNTTPKYCKPRPLPFTLKSKVEAELQRLVDADVLCPVSSSEYATPIVAVLKKCGSIRICGDYRALNKDLEIDRYPLPRVDEIFAELQRGDRFSKIDLSNAYMQLRLDQESQKLVTISTHKGLFSYKRLPYGVHSGTSLFQKIIEETLQGLPGVACFLDDILITAPDSETHVNRLREVCKRLSLNGFTVKREKCNFFAEKLEYLGFVIDKVGLHPCGSKVKAIIGAPVPQNVTQVKAFAGLVQYYGKFVPNLSSIMSPMYNLLRKDVPFVFDEKCLKAFKQVKELLTTAPILAHYDPQAHAVLTVDASSAGLGCVLSIIDSEGVERPVSYSSRTLSPAERNYSMIDKEATAIVYGVKKYHQYLYGRHFTLKCDHKPLLSIFGPKKGIPVFAAGRLQRYALFLSGYSFDIKYVKSEENSADALSRLPLSVEHKNVNSDELAWVGTYLHCIKESSAPIDCEQIKAETQKDHVLKKVYHFIMCGWPSFLSEEDSELRAFFQRREELTVEMGVIMWGYRVVVPKSLQEFILKELHSSHLGIVKMKGVARAYVYWPGIDSDIERIANSCSSCLQERPNPPKAELHVWQYPSSPWERLNLDYLGPFKGKMYLIVIDAHTKWLEVFETSSTAAHLAIENLRTLFARFGIPKVCVSDNGPPFSSAEFKGFLNANGIQHKTSPPYHPQSNGQAENSVKYVKHKLQSAIRDNKDVSIAINRILLDYRNAIHVTTNETPARLMFGRNLRTRFDLLRPSVSSAVAQKQEKQKSYCKGTNTRYLSVNQPVIVRDYRSNNNKWVEGIVIKQISNVMYIVKLCSGILWKRHINQIVAIDTGNVDVYQDVNNADSPVTAVVEPVVVSADDSPTNRPTVTSPRTPVTPRQARQSLVPSSATSPVTFPISPVSRSAVPNPSPVIRRSNRERKQVERLNL